MGDSAAEYVCECSAPDCKSTISLTRSEYEWVRADGRRFVICANHENPELDRVIVETKTFGIIEMLPGGPAQTAGETDPRRHTG